jgi:prophage regulatory protein
MAAQQDRILRPNEASAFVGLGYSTLRAKNDPNSPQYDPDFPEPISLGKRAKGWPLSRLRVWLRKRSKVAA